MISISVWQIVKIFEVSNLGKKKDTSQIANYKDNDLHGKLMFAFLVFIYLVTIYSFVSYSDRQVQSELHHQNIIPDRT